MPRILVVDDEQPLCLVLKDLLEMEGHEVQTCNNVDAAKNLLSISNYDAAMVDVFLTEDPLGLTLGRYILENYPRTSLVMMTGYAEERDIRKGFASGVYACVRKPFMLDDVIRVIETATSTRKTGSSMEAAG